MQILAFQAKHQQLSFCPKTTCVYVRVTDPFSSLSNFDRSEGGSHVMLTKGGWIVALEFKRLLFVSYFQHSQHCFFTVTTIIPKPQPRSNYCNHDNQGPPPQSAHSVVILT